MDLPQAPLGLECGEMLSAFDASPDKGLKTQDAAALLVLLSQSSEPEGPGAESLHCMPVSMAPAQAHIVPGTLHPQMPMQSPQPSLEYAQAGFPSPSQKRVVVKVDRVLRCGACDGCKRADCGRCPNCRDKPKFGGAGVKKQACQHRRCLQPTRTGGGRWAHRPPVATSGDVDSDDASNESTLPYQQSPGRMHPQEEVEEEDECERNASPGLSMQLDRTPLTDAQQGATLLTAAEEKRKQLLPLVKEDEVSRVETDPGSSAYHDELQGFPKRSRSEEVPGAEPLPEVPTDV